jgi:hypothetical protein
MAILSPLAAASDKTRRDDIDSSPGEAPKVTDSAEKVPKEQSDSTIVSPLNVSQSPQENTAERDDDGESENTWKGDSWSEEDVRKLFIEVNLFCSSAGNLCELTQNNFMPLYRLPHCRTRS